MLTYRLENRSQDGRRDWRRGFAGEGGNSEMEGAICEVGGALGNVSFRFVSLYQTAAIVMPYRHLAKSALGRSGASFPDPSQGNPVAWLDGSEGAGDEMSALGVFVLPLFPTRQRLRPTGTRLRPKPNLLTCSESPIIVYSSP